MASPSPSTSVGSTAESTAAPVVRMVPLKERLGSRSQRPELPKPTEPTLLVAPDKEEDSGGGGTVTTFGQSNQEQERGRRDKEGEAGLAINSTFLFTWRANQ